MVSFKVLMPGCGATTSAGHSVLPKIRHALGRKSGDDVFISGAHVGGISCKGYHEIIWICFSFFFCHFAISSVIKSISLVPENVFCQPSNRQIHHHFPHKPWWPLRRRPSFQTHPHLIHLSIIGFTGNQWSYCIYLQTYRVCLISGGWDCLILLDYPHQEFPRNPNYNPWHPSLQSLVGW